MLCVWDSLFEVSKVYFVLFVDELSASTSEQSLFDKTAVDENHLDRNQFVDICETFLGDEPMK